MTEFDISADISVYDSDTGIYNSSDPLTNRGSYLQKEFYQVQVHWLQGIIDGLPVLPDLMNYVLSFTHGVPTIYDKTTKNGQYWDGFAICTCGSKFYWQYGENTQEVVKILFIIPGSTCESIGVSASILLMTNLRRFYSARFTRDDLKIRFPRSIVDFDQIIQAGDSHNFKGARTKPKLVRSSEPIIGTNLEYDFYTVYFGSNKSDSFARFYDSLVHNVPHHIDLEIVFKDELADAVVDEFMNFNKDTPKQKIYQKIANIVLSKITFIDRTSKQKNMTRHPILEWWQNLLDKFKHRRIKPVAKVIRKTFQRFKKYVDRSVISGLTALSLAHGTRPVLNWLEQQIREKRQYLSAEWLALVEDYNFRFSGKILVNL